MNALLGAWLDFERFPVRHTPTGPAADRFQSSIALDVFGGVLRVSCDLYCAELEVDPRSSDATAERAVAGSCHRGSGRQLQFDGAAVAGALMHGSFCSSSAAGGCEA